MADAVTIPDTPGLKWSGQINAYNKTFKPWLKRMDKVVRRYRDERRLLGDTATDTTDDGSVDNNIGGGKYNILYSNTSVLQPAIYSKTPQPVVSRRYADKDPVARTASEILQRCLATTIEEEFDNVMFQCRDDYLFGGRGTSWVRYEVKWGDDAIQTPAMNDAGAPVMGQDGQPSMMDAMDEDKQPIYPVEAEYACTDYIEARDFAHTPVRKWKDVTWVARRHYFDKDEAVKVLGEANAKLLKYIEHSTKPTTDNAKNPGGTLDGLKKAEVWEIWDKVSKKVLFWSDSDEAKEVILKSAPVPIDFRNFFPCPQPCYGITTNGSLIPVPYFAEYQDQANELDKLTTRMDNLLGACKVSGLYDSSIGVDIQALMQSYELSMQPVDNMAAKYAEKGGKGGLDSFVLFNPIDVFAKVYEQLRAAREQIKRDTDEITGISDIIRGQSAPNATATAEQIKSNYATLRLDRMKGEMARFARDTIRLVAEIVCECFKPETIIEMAGVQYMPDDFKASAVPAIELLKNDKQRTFRVDIETDSTVALDEMQEKSDRLEFLNTMATFLEGGLKIGQEAPELAPLIKESIMFAVRSFKAGRQMEGNFEQALDAMEAKAKQAAQQPKQDPEMVKAQQEAQLKQQEAQQNAKLAQAKAQQDAQLAQSKAAGDQQTAQVKAASDIQVAQVESQASIRASELEAQAKIASDEKIAMLKIESDERIEMARIAAQPKEPTGVAANG